MVQAKNSKVIPAPMAPRPQEARKRVAGEDAITSPQAKKANNRKFRKVPWRAISFVLLVVLPTVMVGVYYAFWAADQYAVKVRFAVRSTTPAVGSSFLNSLGIGNGASITDTYMVVEYIHSRNILKEIDEKIRLRPRYMKPSRDFYARLAADTSDERFLDYWKSMVDVGLDHTSNIITVKVFAFSPNDARDIADAIINASERMINDISRRAQQDAVRYAKEEVAKAEAKLRDIRQRFLGFRNKNQQLDPTKQAQVQVGIIGRLEEELVKLKAKLEESRRFLSDNAPSVVFLTNRVNALKKQIALEKEKLGTTPSRKNVGQSLSNVLSEYEALVVEREFAEKLYLTALSGLEQARLLANRQQRYLATFEQPYVPDEALYPKRIRNTVFIFISLALIWGIGVLMLQSIRDRI